MSHETLKSPISHSRAENPQPQAQRWVVEDLASGRLTIMADAVVERGLAVCLSLSFRS